MWNVVDLFFNTINQMIRLCELTICELWRRRRFYFGFIPNLDFFFLFFSQHNEYSLIGNDNKKKCEWTSDEWLNVIMMTWRKKNWLKSRTQINDSILRCTRTTIESKNWFDVHNVVEGKKSLEIASLFTRSTLIQIYNLI